MHVDAGASARRTKRGRSMRGSALAAALALVALSNGGSAGKPYSCSGRADCSEHGVCDATGACVCDASFFGHRCDIWRPPPRPELAVLRTVKWYNCTHGSPHFDNHSAALIGHCRMWNKTICEAAGAPTVPPPNWNQECYQKPRPVPTATGGTFTGNPPLSVSFWVHF